MVDLSAMRTVAVDPARRTARVGAGALLADVDRATQAHGLAVPLGINSTTGVAGLTLGGGFGWLTRRLGMTVDNLLGVTVVTADGAVRAVSASSEPDCSGRCAAAAATSASRPRSSSSSTRSARALRRARRLSVRAGTPGPARMARLQRRRARRAERLGGAAQGAAAALPAASAHGTDVVVFALVHSGDVEAGSALPRPCSASASRSRATSDRRRTRAFRPRSTRC
jgi:FAD/FMN-containing dehydrogenase